MVNNTEELLGAENRDEAKLKQRKNALKNKLQTLQTPAEDDGHLMTDDTTHDG